MVISLLVAIAWLLTMNEERQDGGKKRERRWMERREPQGNDNSIERWREGRVGLIRIGRGLLDHNQSL